jgi:hypothetical protein
VKTDDEMRRIIEATIEAVAKEVGAEISGLTIMLKATPDSPTTPDRFFSVSSLWCCRSCQVQALEMTRDDAARRGALAHESAPIKH